MRLYWWRNPNSPARVGTPLEPSYDVDGAAGGSVTLWAEAGGEPQLGSADFGQLGSADFGQFGFADFRRLGFADLIPLGSVDLPRDIPSGGGPSGRSVRSRGLGFDFGRRAGEATTPGADVAPPGRAAGWVAAG